MLPALGLWLLTLGYGLTYTGGLWFMDSGTAPTLSQAFGLQHALLQSPAGASGAAPSSYTSSGGKPGSSNVPVSAPSSGPGGSPSPITSGTML